MDLKMPDIDGFETTKLLRKQGFTNPIVVLTGSESDEDRQRAKEVGCDEYILKTMGMRDVESILDRYLQKGGGLD